MPVYASSRSTRLAAEGVDPMASSNMLEMSSSDRTCDAAGGDWVDVTDDADPSYGSSKSTSSPGTAFLDLRLDAS
ncbi:MAG: hypothetical protein IPJ01_11995 [Micavibrio sp.]|nr:hypothetical protein [Micavibrio sp.]